MGNIAVAVAVIAVLAIVFIAAAHVLAPADVGDSQWVNASEAQSEYNREVKALDFAQGDFPARRYLTVAFDGAPQYYERGIGAIDAQQDWFCSWVEEELRHSPGSAASRLSQVRTMTFYTSALQGNDRKAFDKDLRLMETGDRPALESYNANSCQ